MPKVRGRERSVSVEEIVDQVRRLEVAGCREVVFTGTQLGHYGFDLEDGVDLTFLLRSVLAMTEMPRIRVSSLQPPEIDDRLLELWVAEGEGRLCPHFHVPLQSGSDGILRRMRRTYTSDEFLQKVEFLRTKVAGCGITTDVIAGFPGETDEDHARSVSVMRAAEFSDAHVFPYSARPGTSANHFDEQLEPGTKAERAAMLREISAASASRFRDAIIGEVRPVLWEGRRGRTGLTDNYVKVRLDSVDERGDGLIEEVALRGVDADGVVFGQAI